MPLMGIHVSLWYLSFAHSVDGYKLYSKLSDSESDSDDETPRTGGSILDRPPLPAPPLDWPHKDPQVSRFLVSSPCAVSLCFHSDDNTMWDWVLWEYPLYPSAPVRDCDHVRSLLFLNQLSFSLLVCGTHFCPLHPSRKMMSCPRRRWKGFEWQKSDVL